MQLLAGFSYRVGRLAAAIVCAVAVMTTFGLAIAQEFAPYSDFLAMTQEELLGLQVKFTWVGPQESRMGSVILVVNGASPDFQTFREYARPKYSYLNDGLDPDVIEATVQELDAMIDSVASLPGVTDGGVDSVDVLSFSLLNTVNDSVMCFEAIVDFNNGHELFALARGALRANKNAIRALTDLACVTMMTQPDTPPEVTSSVRLTFGAFREDRATGESVGIVRVENISSSMLPAPVSLIIESEDSNVYLMNADGTTCEIDPGGRTYINLPVGSGLEPGEFVEAELRFENLDHGKIDLYWNRVTSYQTGEVVQPRVFAGPGER